MLIGLPETLFDADDTDSVRFVMEYLDNVIKVLCPFFQEDFMLIVNTDTTVSTL